MLISLLLFTSLGSPARAETPIEVRVENAANEQYERDVDQVAQASQQNAIFKLTGLLKKYQGTSQEPVLLAKLADLQQQNAAMLFRIAHGASHRGNKPLDLSRYKKSMEQAVTAYTTLIRKYPNFSEIAHVYFMRGKSFEELEKVPAATQDYLTVVKNYPLTEETLSAYMSLAEFRITANDHPQAILYLKEVEKYPQDTHYPFALYKMAWSYYNLKNIPMALSYAERNVAYYNAPSPEDAAIVGTSNNALKENALVDMPVFYFEGYEENIPQYSLAEALGYFKKQENGPVLGRMLLRFAKLLRAHSHETDLIAWKDQLIHSEPDLPETLDVVIATYEYQQNKRYFTQLMETAHDLVKIYAKHPKYESFPKAQKMLLETADNLQTAIVKNKAADDVKDYSTYLASIYASFAQMVDDKDPRIPRVHYNLAETLFEIKDYAQATENYRWIVTHLGWNAKLAKSISKKEQDFSIADAALKAVASRYEILRANKTIPLQLQAKPLQKDPDKDLASQDPILNEWIDWIEEYQRKAPQPQGNVDTFAFEANRAIYGQGYLNQAVKRMIRFSEDHPKSSYAIPSATLVIDTYILTQNWEKTLDLANDFLDVKEWKKNEFSTRMTSVASDATYKIAEALFRNKDYKGTLSKADDFLKKYPTSARIGDTLSLAGNSAVLLGEKTRAVGYYTRLIKDLPPSESSAKAIVARAEIYEDHYALNEAAADYRLYLALPANLQEKDTDKNAKIQINMKRKLLAFSWLAGSEGDLKAALSSKEICGGPQSSDDLLSEDCEKYRTLSSGLNPDEAFDQARKAEGQNKTILALIALKGAKALAFRDRLLMVRFVSQGWDALDPLLKFSLTPTLVDVLPRTFSLNRMAMNEVAPLRAEERYITHRVDMIHEMENGATKSMKLPWARVKAEILNEIGGLYLDLSHGLGALPPPKNLSSSDLTTYEDTIRKLTVPFEDKGMDMRSKAFEIASRASVDNESYKGISESFFSENPSQAKALHNLLPNEKPRDLNSDILKDWDQLGEWGAALKHKDDIDEPDDQSPATRVQKRWLRAVASQHWALAGYLMQAAQDRKLLSAQTLSFMRVVYLNSIGARAEALAELEETASSLPPDTKRAALATLIQYSMNTYSKPHAQALLKEYIATWDKDKKIPTDQAKWIATTSNWANSK